MKLTTKALDELAVKVIKLLEEYDMMHECYVYVNNTRMSIYKSANATPRQIGELTVYVEPDMIASQYIPSANDKALSVTNEGWLYDEYTMGQTSLQEKLDNLFKSYDLYPEWYDEIRFSCYDI